MRTVLVLVLVSMMLGLSCDVFACDTQAKATAESTCVVLPFQVRRGVWFELQMADTLRYEHELVPALQEQISIYRDITKLQGEQIGELTKAIESGRKTDVLSKEKQTEVEDALAKERADTHFGSKAAVFVGGIVAGILIALTVHEVKK